MPQNWISPQLWLPATSTDQYTTLRTGIVDVTQLQECRCQHGEFRFVSKCPSPNTKIFGFSRSLCAKLRCSAPLILITLLGGASTFGGTKSRPSILFSIASISRSISQNISCVFLCHASLFAKAKQTKAWIDNDLLYLAAIPQ